VHRRFFDIPLTKAEQKNKDSLNFMLKFCDMGNACYVDEHYSDII